MEVDTEVFVVPHTLAFKGHCIEELKGLHKMAFAVFNNQTCQVHHFQPSCSEGIMEHFANKD